MARQICGLRKRVAQSLCEELPNIGIIEEHINDDLVDIILDDSVILKVYYDNAVLDQGQIKSFLGYDEFESIQIR